MSAPTDRKRKNNEKYNQKINCNRNVRCAYRRFGSYDRCGKRV